VRAAGLQPVAGPVGSRAGELRPGSKLDIVETLRVAAPWQALRRRQREAEGTNASRAAIEIRKQDFRLKRFQQPAESTAIFIVDASGSSALNRLAEAKGAVELLLAECYVRRDQVALIAFRDDKADLLLPPTRSLVRAKGSLTALAGGGGTPLANAIDAGLLLSETERRRGRTPVMVLLTDGQANVARDGKRERAAAREDAADAARRVRRARRAQPAARYFAAAFPPGCAAGRSDGRNSCAVAIRRCKGRINSGARSCRNGARAGYSSLTVAHHDIRQRKLDWEREASTWPHHDDKPFRDGGTGSFSRSGGRSGPGLLVAAWYRCLNAFLASMSCRC
jgi:Mg-chelatase subunit ChlD